MTKLKKAITAIAAVTLLLCGSCTEYASNTQMVLCLISAAWLALVTYAEKQKSRRKGKAAQN